MALLLPSPNPKRIWGDLGERRNRDKECGSARLPNLRGFYTYRGTNKYHNIHTPAFPQSKHGLGKATGRNIEAGLKKPKYGQAFQIYVGFNYQESPTPSLPKSKNGFGEGDLNEK
jgi:hypothetical protein